MKSWFEAEAGGSASQRDFVPYSSADDDFVPFAAEVQSSAASTGLEATCDASSDTSSEAASEAALAAAYERGLADARAERSEAEALEATRAFGVLDAAAADVRGRVHREASQWSRAVIDLAMLVAERIVRAQLPLDREALQSRVIAAIERVSDENGARLLVAPADLAWVESHLQSELAALREVRALEVEADPALEGGEFRVEHRGAVVDGRVEAMLERFREELMDFDVDTGGDAS